MKKEVELQYMLVRVSATFETDYLCTDNKNKWVDDEELADTFDSPETLREVINKLNINIDEDLFDYYIKSIPYVEQIVL